MPSPESPAKRTTAPLMTWRAGAAPGIVVVVIFARLVGKSRLTSEIVKSSDGKWRKGRNDAEKRPIGHSAPQGWPRKVSGRPRFRGGELRAGTNRARPEGAQPVFSAC